MNKINEKTTLQFPDDFFREEIRCDYTITEKTKKVWAIEIDLLYKLLEVCKKYDIKVYAFAGTLLGAVRHNGFIPWDDDIDVCMMRGDYEKFLKVAPQEFKEPYFLQTPLTDRQYFYGCSRLRNSLTTGFITFFKSANFNSGICIDIFVLDGYIEDESLFNRQMKKKYLLDVLIAAYHPENEERLFQRFIYKIAKNTICKLISYEKVIGWYDQLLSQYNNETNRLSILNSTIPFIKKYWCFKDNLDKIVWMDFENIKIPVPFKYKEMLTNMYGDFMEYPPIEKRGAWHAGQLELDPDIPYIEYLKRKQ